MKKLLISIVAVFVSVFITDFLIHGLILKSMYGETASLWRPESEMAGLMPFMFAGQFVVSAFFAWIFAFGYRGKGVSEGIRFGLLIGAFEAGRNLIMHAVTPYPLNMTLAWIALGLVQTVICGVVVSLVWGKDRFVTG